MHDRDLYAKILGVSGPWKVDDVRLDESSQEVVVRLGHTGEPLLCPECQSVCPGYDRLPRRWRHLDTCQFQTIIEAPVPRCECPEHGVRQINVPWAEPGSRFTVLFERLAIDWMREAGRAAVARRLALTWKEAHGVMQRAVRRGLTRRRREAVELLGVDEKSFRRHEYVTVVCDLAEGKVLHVGDDRSSASLDQFYEGLSDEQLGGVNAIAMDMHQPYVQSTLTHLPDAEAKIVFDKFHIAKHLTEAVDQVRRAEHKQLSSVHDDRLKGTKYGWLRNPTKESADQKAAMKPLRQSKLRTARAWALKETVMNLWDYSYRRPAEKFFGWWYSWAIRSRLPPIKKAARTLKRRLANILTYLTYPITNAASESLNAKIQWIKYTARGFKSRESFKTAIYFHCGGLDLYPH